jgi:uncharacterized protein (TIGR02594 family)
MKMHHKQFRAYQIAKTHIGTVEIPGPEDNPKIVGWAAKVLHSWVQDDETAWCASFLGAMLEEAELPSTRALNARSYLDWGWPVKFADVIPGDIVVFWRVRPDGWQGHVGFYAGITNDRLNIKVLGGNQGDRVSHALYAKSRLLGVRRYPASTTAADPAEGCWTRFVKGLVGGGTNIRNER